MVPVFWVAAQAPSCHYELTLESVNHSRQKTWGFPMTLSRSRHLTIVSTIAALMAIVPASARAQSVTAFASYMHSGPGFEFAVIDEIPKRTPLVPEMCKAGWCRISYGGVAGWVEQKLLVAGPTTAQPKPGERPLECMDFARTGWPDAGDLERVCIFAPNKEIALDKPAG